jgi:tape measure domain-containing protein
VSIDAETLVTQVTADTSSADQTLAQFSARTAEQLAGIETKIDGLGSGGAGGGAGGQIDDFFGKFLTFQAVVQAGRAIEGFVQSAVTAYAENERLGLSLETLVAREERNKDATLSMAEALDMASPKAQELLHWNEQLAVNSPFNEAGIASAFRTAEAFGFVSESADKTAITAKRLTQDLVDFTAGSGQSTEVLNRISAALGKVEVSGQLSGREVRELTLAGVQVDTVLAKAFGKSTEEIVKLREQGLIPGDQAIKAIAYSLENDFGGAAQRQAGTVSGLLNSMSDLETIGSRQLFSGAIQAAQPYLQQFVDTLNSPEAKANIEAISADLGTIVNDDLPQIISQGQFWLAGVRDVYGVIKPIADTYHAIQNIKLPGGADVGNILGSDTLISLTTGGYIPDLVGQFGKLTGATQDSFDAMLAASQASEQTLKETGDQLQANAAYDLAYGIAIAARTDRTKDDTQTAGEVRQEQEKLTLATRAHGEELKKYQGELDKTGETGQAAYEKLHDSQAAFASAEQTRAGDHQARLASIEQSALDQRATAQQNYRDSDADRQAGYHDRLASLATSAARAETDAQNSEHDRQAQALESHQLKVGDIQQRGLERIAAEQAQEAQRAVDYQAQRTDLAVQAATQLADIQTREHDRAASSEQSYQDRIAGLVQRGADMATQAAAQLADRQQQYAQRTADLIANAADTAQTNDEQFQEDKATRAGDHNDRLGDLQTQLNAATDAKQKASIQKQIDSETERYDKQEAKAQTSYERQEAKAEKALQKQLDQAAQAEARQEQQASLALAKQQDQLAKEQALQDAAYAAAEAKAKTAYATQLTTQDAQTQAQLAKVQEAHAKQIASDEARYQSDMAGMQKAYNAEIDGYSRSEANQAQHLTTAQQKRQAALAQQLSDAQTAFDSAEQKAQATFDKQEKAADLARQKQITSENTSYAHAERAATIAYDKQQASLDAALGKQLLAYTDTQLKMSAITAGEADKRHALIAKEFGVDPQAAQGQFAAYLAQLSSPTGVTSYVGGPGAAGSGLAINGGVTINISGVSDPIAAANEAQRQLLLLQNRNGGTGLHQ